MQSRPHCEYLDVSRIPYPAVGSKLFDDSFGLVGRTASYSWGRGGGGGGEDVRIRNASHSGEGSEGDDLHSGIGVDDWDDVGGRCTSWVKGGK